MGARGETTRWASARRQLARRAAAFGLVVGIVVLGAAGCSASGGGSAPAADGGADGGVVGEPGGGAADGTDADRSVIVEGSMSIVVDDVAAATDAAVVTVDANGGRIDGREESAASDENAMTTLILRIPAASLDAAIDRLRKLGTVESLQTSSRDVTAQTQDLDARIAGLRSTLTRLESFQASATSVTDLLAIEKEIASRQTELEQLTGQQKALGEQIDYSTITLTLRAKPSPSVVPDTFGSGFVVGWNAFVAFVGGFLVVLGVLLPWLLVAAVVAAVIVLLVRGRRRRRRARAAEAAAETPPTAQPGYAVPAGQQGPPVSPYPTGVAGPQASAPSASSPTMLADPPQAAEPPA